METVFFGIGFALFFVGLFGLCLIGALLSSEPGIDTEALNKLLHKNND